MSQGYNSPPPKSLLYNLAQKLFGINTAAQAEPIVATFCRSIVDQNNNLLLTQAQLLALVSLASGATGVPISFPIPSGQDFVHVTGLGLAFNPTKCLVTVMKLTGGLNLGATCRYDTLSPDGFTADLTGVTDGSTYILCFTLA